MGHPAEKLAGIHPKPLRVSGEASHKSLAEQSETERKCFVGKTIARAFALAKVTQQEAAYAMHYQDQGTVSRWCSGLERPHFDKLFTVSGFYQAWILALASEDESSCSVEQVITLRKVG